MNCTFLSALAKKAFRQAGCILAAVCVSALPSSSAAWAEPAHASWTTWVESVADADDAFLEAGDVRDGKALVVCPVSSQSQFEALADEFGSAGVPVLSKDKSERWTISLKGCNGWERPRFAPRGEGERMALLRMGKGLVVLSALDVREDKAFNHSLSEELLMQNEGFAFRGVSFQQDGAKGRSGKPVRGKGRAEISLANTGVPLVDVTARLMIMQSGAEPKIFAANGASAAKGPFKIAIEGDFVAYGRCRARLDIVSKDSWRSYVVGEWTLDWPEYFSFVAPEYRGMVSTARREATVHLGALFDDIRGEKFAGRVADISVTGPDGGEVASFQRTFGDSPRLAFDVDLARDAPEGEYKVAIRSSDAAGEPVAASGSFKVVPVRKGQVFVDQDGVLLADGKPWYPFGIYHLAGKDNIEAAAAMGLDMAQLWSAPKENMEALVANGIRLVYETEAWSQVINTYIHGQGLIPDKYPFETDAGFRSRAELVRSYPTALAMYYTSDEGDPPVLPGIRHVRDYWAQLDPEDHPTYLVATRDPAMAAGADVIGVDCYPRSFGAKRPMTGISDLVAKFNEALPGRCVIAVPEAFGHTANHKETPEECKCMAYLSMVAGAKGVFWYCWWDGGNQGASNDAGTRRAITEVTGEAKAFKLALLAPGGVMLKSEDGRVLARLCGDDSTGRFLVAVNGSDEASDGVFVSPSLAGLSLEPLFDSPATKPDADGRFSAPLAPAARAVWRITANGWRSRPR